MCSHLSCAEPVLGHSAPPPPLLTCSLPCRASPPSLFQLISKLLLNTPGVLVILLPFQSLHWTVNPRTEDWIGFFFTFISLPHSMSLVLKRNFDMCIGLKEHIREFSFLCAWLFLFQISTIISKGLWLGMVKTKEIKRKL